MRYLFLYHETDSILWDFVLNDFTTQNMNDKCLIVHNGISNGQRLNCLLNRSFMCASKKTSKLHVTGLCDRNSPRTLMMSSWNKHQNTFAFEIIYQHRMPSRIQDFMTLYSHGCCCPDHARSYYISSHDIHLVLLENSCFRNEGVKWLIFLPLRRPIYCLTFVSHRGIHTPFDLLSRNIWHAGDL